MLSQLERYVITYEDETGKVVCNIPDYYRIKVAPLMGKFKRYSFDKDRMVICPFHDDHDPSLGIIKHKFLNKVMIYHCMGCGSAGTIVRFHQRIERQYHKRDISDKESCIELCSIFGIPVPDDDVFNSEDYSKIMQSRYYKIDKLQERYTEKEFARSLLEIRRSDVDLNRVNSECVKMIATIKGLYR